MQWFTVVVNGAQHLVEQTIEEVRQVMMEDNDDVEGAVEQRDSTVEPDEDVVMESEADEVHSEDMERLSIAEEDSKQPAADEPTSEPEASEAEEPSPPRTSRASSYLQRRCPLCFSGTFPRNLPNRYVHSSTPVGREC